MKRDEHGEREEAPRHDHDRYREWVALAQYGELDAFESRSLHQHLEGCSSCRELASDFAAGLARLKTPTGSSPAEAMESDTATPRAAGFGGAVTGLLGLAAGVLVTWSIGTTPAPAAPSVSEPSVVHLDLSKTPPPATGRGRLAQLAHYLGR